MTTKEFFFMGGYAWAVWSAYLVGAVILGFNSVTTYVLQRRIKNKIQQQIKRAEFLQHEK